MAGASTQPPYISYVITDESCVQTAQDGRGRKRKNAVTDPWVKEKKRRAKNKRESTRVKHIAEWYKNLAISQGWKGRKWPPKLEILDKTIQYIRELQERKKLNESQVIIALLLLININSRVLYL